MANCIEGTNGSTCAGGKTVWAACSAYCRPRFFLSASLMASIALSIALCLFLAYFSMAQTGQ